MSQSTTAVVVNTTVPPGDTGPTQAAKVNALRAAVLTTFSGASRPSEAQAGTIWLDTSGTPWTLAMYDGSTDIALADIDPATHALAKLYLATATTLLDGLMAAADKVKLTGIAAGATVNADDAYLLARANHTGSQAQSTVTNLVADLAAKAALGTEGQTLSGGFAITSKSLGNISSGTLTPVVSARQLQHYVNLGAHTIAAPAADGLVMLQITNGSTAGAITWSGFKKVSGDPLTTVNGRDFIVNIVRANGKAWAFIADDQS